MKMITLHLRIPCFFVVGNGENSDIEKEHKVCEVVLTLDFKLKVSHLFPNPRWNTSVSYDDGG